MAGYHGPLVLTGSGGPAGGAGLWCSAPSFPLHGPVLTPSGVSAVPGSPLPAQEWDGRAQPAPAACSFACCLCVRLHAAPHWPGETLWALPPICPPPCRGSGLGLIPRDWFGDNRDCLESGCGGIQPIHPQSSPTAQLRAAEHPCAPAQRGGMSPMSSLSMSLLCVSALPAQSVPWGTQQATCEYARGPWAGLANSSFAFPSLDPGFLPCWWWLGLVWLGGRPTLVWGLRSSPAPQLLLQPCFGAGCAMSLQGPCPGGLLGVCCATGLAVCSPPVLALTCHPALLLHQSLLGSLPPRLQPGVLAPGALAPWRARKGNHAGSLRWHPRHGTPAMPGQQN